MTVKMSCPYTDKRTDTASIECVWDVDVTDEKSADEEAITIARDIVRRLHSNLDGLKIDVENVLIPVMRGDGTSLGEVRFNPFGIDPAIWWYP